MDFPEQLATLRKDKGITQKELADDVGVSAIQLPRYETGASQPPLDVIRKLSVVLGVSADLLLFDTDERGPDEELRLQFGALSRFDPEDKKVVKVVLDSRIFKHEAKRWTSGA